MAEEMEKQRAADHEKFVRWQGHTLVQLGVYTNVLLALAAGELSVLFGITYEADRIAFPGTIIASGVVLFLSIATGCCLALNRLRDFRATKTAANERRREHGSEKKRSAASRKAERLGRRTWRLLWIQSALFVLGSLLLFVAAARSAWSHFPSS